MAGSGVGTVSPLVLLVTGASGAQGYALCQALIALSTITRPLQIRAMVRNASTPSAQRLLELPQLRRAERHASLLLTEADFTDPQSLSRVFQGIPISAVFLNTTPTFNDPQEEVRRARALLTAAAAAESVRHVVYTSVVGVADEGQRARVGGLPHWAREAEAQLRPADIPSEERVRFRAGAFSSPDTHIATDSFGRKLLQGYWGAKAQIEYLTRRWAVSNENSQGRSWSIIRPGWFMANFLPPGVSNYWPELAGGNRVLRSAISPQARMMLADPKDIGAVAARALLAAADGEEGLIGKTINVGSQAVGLNEIANTLSEVSGIKVSAVHVSDREAAEEVRAGNLQRDTQAWSAEAQDCFEPAALEALIGCHPTTLREYLTTRKRELEDFFGQD